MAALLFRSTAFSGFVLFFRDIHCYYYPNYVFLARSLAEGTWPLWNPTSDGGAPFLASYLPDLLLVGLMGPQRTLSLGTPLHLCLAMCGATQLAKRLGMGPWGAWASGLFYGLSGWMLSAVNLVPLFQGAAWAPWVVSAFLGLVAAPTSRGVSVLALLAAVQISTLAAETILQTALAALVLLRRPPTGRAWSGLGAAAVLCVFLSAPTLLGTGALVEDTRRSRGFTPEESLSWSATPPVVIEALLPRFFGDPHTFSDEGYWGQPFFPQRYPYLVSLYLGLPLVLLAARAGPGMARVWLLAGFGALCALGDRGPFGFLLAPLMWFLRTPVKFFLLSTLALAVLAGRGLDRAVREDRRASLAAILPGALLVLTGAALWKWPGLAGSLLGSVLPEIRTREATVVIGRTWPSAFALTGGVALTVALALRAGSRWVPVAAVLVGVDLFVVNGPINPATSAAFYELQPAMKSMVQRASAEGRYRWFSYGVPDTPGLHWRADPKRPNSDLWLYYMDRQSLLPRTHVLDALEGAFDEDRTGWAPEGSTMAASERTPLLYRSHHARLRLANVRWVVSFLPLPEDLVRLREQIQFSTIVEPLRLYEIKDALPRAFWVPRAEVVPRDHLLSRLAEPGFDPRANVLLETAPAGSVAEGGAPPATATVLYAQPDPHTLRLTFSGPAGYVVVLDGFHRDWHAEVDGRPTPILRANGRHWGLPVAAGEHTLTASYRPAWRVPSLACATAGLLTALALLIRGSS